MLVGAGIWRGRETTIIEAQAAVTRAVLEAMSRTEDPRLRAIVECLVTHLHDFVRGVRLTDVEFQQPTRLLHNMGQQKTDTHNESVPGLIWKAISQISTWVSVTSLRSTRNGPFETRL